MENQFAGWSMAEKETRGGGDDGDDAATVHEPAEESHHHHWELSLQDAQDWFDRRKSRGQRQRRSSLVLQRTTTGKRWWKFTLRPWDDDEYQDWWFAGTAIPLLAATIGPLANVFSIAALVTYWRMCLVAGVDKEDAAQCVWDGNPNSFVLEEPLGTPYRDPRWCYNLNVVSLVAGFVGNFFLLCNFTGRIRYIVALPVTIVLWYVATGILIGITAHMAIIVPPQGPQQVYTEGFWYAVLAACMYMISSMLLMVNMLGYFLGHYPQHFNLTDSQRTLILQTMLFFIWLAGGGEIFSVVETKYGNDPTQNWSYVNALYFCDVTILTVGFGDLYCTSDLGRGLLFPYSVGGIIMLGLMVSSIAKFAGEIGSENIIRKHVEQSRARTAGRTITSSLELDRRPTFVAGERPSISAPMNPIDRAKSTAITFSNDDEKSAPIGQALKKVATLVTKPPRQRKPKLLLLREEKDRFEAMRHIQANTNRYKNWYALCISITAFGILWCVGAVVFWRCEHKAQHMSYFEALYFCYVSLLTIGYGDFAPKTNAGRAFFVLWSLIAVPTMTILVSDLGSTVINKFKEGTFRVADFTLLPKYGVWRNLLERHQRVLQWLQNRKQRRDAKKRLEQGFQVGPEIEEAEATVTVEQLAKEELTKPQLARKLAKKIRQTATEMKAEPEKRYSYEEWVEITQLIRFTAKQDEHGSSLEHEEVSGLIEWDWIGEDSPMMAKTGEPEFVLDRLCESMHRLIRNVDQAATHHEEHHSPMHGGGGAEKAGLHPFRWQHDRKESVEVERHPGGRDSDDGSIDQVDPLEVRPRTRGGEKRGIDSPSSSSNG